jgi:HK97 family phage major capsid protein
MKVQIELLKSWKNGDTEFVKGRLLSLEKADADRLVEKGICEMYEPKAGDVIKVDDFTPDAGKFELSDENKKEIVNEILKKNADFQLQQDNEDDFLKTGGFSGLGEFAVECRKSAGGKFTEKMSNWMSQVSKAPSGQNEGIDSEGGFLVPTIQRNTLMSNLLETSIAYPLTMKIPMMTDSVGIPVIEDESHALHVYGGIIVYRPDEGGDITASKMKLGKVNLELSKLACLVFATSELLEDSPISIEPMLNKGFGDAIGFQIDEDLMNGNGANQSLGILNAPSLVTVAKESGQANDTIVTNNILKMWSRLRPAGQGSAIWQANIDTFVAIATLALPVGTGGSTAGLMQTSTNGVTGAPITTLLGRPIRFSEHNQTLGDKGDITLADWGQYLVGEKNGGQIRAASSIHLKFVSDQTAFRFIVRMDGKPWEKTALTPKHSTKTLSSFVTLAAR